MSTILKFDFQKRQQLRFLEVNYQNYTKKDPILHVTTTFSLKQGETRTSSGPIPHPIKFLPDTGTGVSADTGTYPVLLAIGQQYCHVLVHINIPELSDTGTMKYSSTVQYWNITVSGTFSKQPNIQTKK